MKAAKRRSRFAPRRVNLRSVSAGDVRPAGWCFCSAQFLCEGGPGPLFDVLGTYQEKDVIEVSGAPEL